LFNTARNEKTAVIFFDEFDSISPNRSDVNSSVMPRVVNELLSQIDGFSKSENTLLLLAATNRPWAIDSGVTRSKRFSEKLYIPLPDFEARKYIIIKNFEGIPIEEDINFDDLAEKTEGFNGADVAEFCNRCRDRVLERCVQAKESGENYDDEKIKKDDIYKTLKKFNSSVNPQDIKKFEDFRKKYDKVD
jgi:transitional endoplasmic reticulum ATPase